MPQRRVIHPEDEEDMYRRLGAVSMLNQAGTEGGSDPETFEMEGKEADLVDPFFDSEEDEPVDMEMVFEAMKHVPLPDIDYPEQDDPISGDPCAAETLQASSLSLLRDRIPQGLLKRKAISAKGEPAKKKGVGATERPQKRVKVEVISHEPRSKLSPKQPVKAENLVGSVRSAQAKVAAEVAPNVFTGGIVAESGPRPDFSLWTVDDDLLLKNAMEVLIDAQ
ncbi:hypothetical protein AXG93_1130s1320 [Marchantia polymorpha subsp. ruderalis]|uniref:Uncharacterized protein n=1 Tax=Marchantia polymorpha subsp. ruderalis TaxID=1480154 RepID=A0A176VG42_MARPO|nr:hypothetical protein AXG93_1130s1320 [Marchantia polymorpha subsp. ruderalis]